MKKMKCFLAGASSLAMMLPSVTPVFAEDPNSSLTPGVTVVEDENGYSLQFVYDGRNSEREISKVSVSGNFQWYKKSEVGGFKGMGDTSSIPTYDAYAYEEGMFNSGYGLNGSATYEMAETEDGVYSTTIPVPGNLYYYDYTITYSDGETETTETVKDPANLPEANPANGHDAGHSLVYVGDAAHTEKGQEYIYPRENQKGTTSFVTYTAIDGTSQPLEVYLPYGYDSTKEYKTIYVSHGGGGNEAEWMSIGAVSNIMDNLIAEGKDPAVVVTMDNNYFNWDYDKVLPNVVDYIIPFIEENYSVSKDAKNRAFCGLSMGSMTTNQMAKTYPNEFRYFGSFSGGSTDLEKSHYDVESLNRDVLYLTAGCIDMAYNNDHGISSLDYTKMYDELGVNYTFDLLDGAHDWGVWRASFTNFVKDYLWNNPEYIISGTEKMYVTGEDWGPAVRKVMLTVDKTVNASDLRAENFTVNETKESTNWADGSVYNATAPRTVTNVYLSDEKGNKINAESGNIITVEMYISPNDGSPFRYDLATGSNKWCNYYELAVEGTVGERTLNIAHVLDLADQSNWITDAAYKFDVTKSFTGSDGIVMPYGQYSPKEDGKKHALVVWLHGAGEGAGALGQYGNDNYVDLLGNEVTSLASDEFQNLFDGGAYVITPQAQTMWMDSGDGQMQMGEKGSMYEKTLFELIDSVVKNNPGIDPDRVIVGGCSNGGYMTMELILKHPDYFYKAYPICEAYKDENITDEQLKAVKEGGTEIWFTYAKNDTTVDPSITAIPTIERMKKLGIQVHTSVWEDVHDTTGTYKDADGNPYQYAGHWSWIYFFNNENVCDECKKSEWKWMAEYPVAETKPAVKPEQKKEDTKKSAKTADTSNPILYTGLMGLMIAAAVVLKKKQA